MGLLLRIIGWLIPFASSFIGRALLALGFGFVEFTGISTLVSYVITQVNQLISSFAASSMVQWAGFFQIDVHFSILLSAIGVKVLLNSLGGATVRRLVQKA